MLSAAQRKALKSQAHRLHPVVTIGDKGLTDAVLREIDAGLNSHELIKVRVASADREQRESCLARICAALDAAPVQHIGRILVIWRERPAPEQSAPEQPAPKREVSDPDSAPAPGPARTGSGKPGSSRRATPRSGRGARSP